MQIIYLILDICLLKISANKYFFFKNHFDFVQYEDFVNLKQDLNIFEKIKGKILLSFDDGLKDHYDFVFPKLLEHKIFGLFFIPTQILSRKKALDVHRIHYLLGKWGGGINKIYFKFNR
ncbi:hypothetical protein OLQ86_06455 [Campylobacter jejuni]|nr:hypothetical protein [Campylobacter jejuni]